MPIILENVNYTYMPNTPFQRQALNNINVSFSDCEFVAVIGHTGSGKSSLMQHLNGLLKPDTGRVLIDGVELHRSKQIDGMIRQRVGVVFQYPEQQLFAETVREDIAFGPKNHGCDEENIDRRVREAMRLVGLDYDSMALRSPFTLSGGQMRRVALAGVLATKPQYLVLDEPSAGLDPRGRIEILRQIYRLHKNENITVILVTHNMEEVAALADRVIVMSGGAVAMNDKPQRVFVDQAERLKEVGLEQPEVVVLLNMLRERGFAVDKDVLTMGAAVRAIYKQLPSNKYAQ